MTSRRVGHLFTVSILFLLTAAHAQSGVVSDIATLPNAPSSLLSASLLTSVQQEDIQPTTVEVKTLDFIWPAAVGLARGDQAKPMTVRKKFQRFMGNSFASSTVAATNYYAEASHVFGSDKEQRWNLGHRYAIAYVDTQSNAFFEDFLIPVITHQNPVYHREAEGSMGERATYAISRVLIARNDTGGSTFNTSSVAGAFMAAELHNAYHPYGNPSTHATMNRALGRLATRAGMNLVREFWPDLRRQHSIRRSPRLVQP